MSAWRGVSIVCFVARRSQRFTCQLKRMMNNRKELSDAAAGAEVQKREVRQIALINKSDFLFKDFIDL